MYIKGTPPIHSPEKLVDIAFRRASREARKIQLKNRRLRKKRAEEKRVRETSSYITTYLTRLEKIGGWVDCAPPFYQELLEVTLGIEKINETIQRLAWARQTISRLEKRARRDIRTSKGDPVVLRKDFYGKTSSIVSKIEPQLEFLGTVIESVRNFPSVLEGYTIVIAGMPNVGKSSLLRQLTSSRPEIKPYPFTTKNILVGYIQDRHRRLQVIDTPGLLDRPIEDRNPIERQSILALKHLAHLIIFLFDPTEICGYPLDSQLELYLEIKENFPDVLPVINKLDIADEAKIKEIEERIGEQALRCSATEGRVEEVYNLVVQLSKKRE